MIAPDNEAALAAAVAEASAQRTPLAVTGGGTLTALGRPMQTAETLTTAGLSGITLYEPAEMVISAWAGTPLADVEAALATGHQRLAFETPDYRALLGSNGTPTIGAVAATNRSGPRRIKAGAARDSLIGVRVVTGRGEVVKNGGRVMKNVTGYDLVKFLAGSWGTLGILSEVSFKVSPVPETEATLVFSGLDDVRAVAALSEALGSPWTITGAAHLPARRQTLLRIDGFAGSVAARLDNLRDLLRGYGTPETLDAAASADIWRAIRDVDVLTAPPGATVWRISVKPADGPRVADAIRAARDVDIVYDWGGGLVWAAIASSGDGGAAIVRRAVSAVGGHATLFRAPDETRLSVDVFEPLPAPMMLLTRKLKAEFDPHGILNPGRMYPGI